MELENGRMKHMVCIDNYATTVTITWSRGLCSSQKKIAQRKMASGLSPRATARLVFALLRRTQYFSKSESRVNKIFKFDGLKVTKVWSYHGSVICS